MSTTEREAPMDQSVASNASDPFIYFFGDGRAEGRGDMKDVLGGKGAGLAEMTNAGVPVPPGFTITTLVCRHYHSNGRQLPSGFTTQQDVALARLENTLGKKLGDADDPLLVSVRSGAKFSMPGMMDTILEPGPERPLGEGPGDENRQRALRLGLLPALHPDVRVSRHGLREA